MFFRNIVKWSPVEVSYLTEHRSDDVSQLCIALAKSMNAIRKKLAEIDGKVLPGRKTKNGRSKIGRREDLSLFVRSSWEANVLRYLNHKGIKWEYEPKTFFFESIKHGNNSYTPDIYLTEEDIYVEIKGWMKAADRAKINRFCKFYPVEAAKLRVVTGSAKTAAAKFFRKAGIKNYGPYFNTLCKKYRKVIPNWES